MMKRSRSRSTSTTAAEQVAGITDVLSEILLRLPPKPLLHFRLVSKHWLSLISDPQFRHLHTTLHHHHNPPSLLLVHHHHHPTPSPSFIIIPLTTPSNARPLKCEFLNRPNVSVIRSCSGPLLCHAAPTFFVCNPTTNDVLPLTLPKQQEPLLENQKRAVYLAFDPSKSPHFDVVSIRITTCYGFPSSDSCEYNVYSSKTNSWSDPASCFTAPRNVVTAPGVFFNGAIHWCNSYGGSSLCLDLGARCLRSFPVPLLDGIELGKRAVEYFGESKGSLHMILGKPGGSLEFDVFELKQDSSLWSLKHSVDLSYARVEFPQLSWGLVNFVLPVYVVCESKEGSKIMLVLFVGGTAISYDPVNCTLRKLCDFKPDMTMIDAVAIYISGQVFQYFESLSPVEAFTA